MNKEIKEILECLEKYGQLTPDAIDDLHYIRDYITNLQVIEQQYSALLSENAELENENKRLNKTIDTILEYNIFKDECPLNYEYATESDEEKAQDIFNEEYCEKCKDDYKKCWLDYFEELKRLKEGK